MCLDVNCGNNGTCNPQTGKCDCKNGYTGANCQTPPDLCKNIDCGNKYASRLLGYEEDCGKIFAAKNLDQDFFKNNGVDVIIDFSH